VCAGKNETSSVFAVNLHPYEGKDIAGKIMAQENNVQPSIGKPLPGIAAKICNDQMAELKADEKGSLWIKGACVASPLNEQTPCGTALNNGWFNTGVVAHIDQQGFIHIV
jgi:long-subunit acyl-CoA synthetase (AMP-forming)